MIEKKVRCLIVGLAVLLLWTVTAFAQTYHSGSTGADGAFAPTANTILTLPPNGVFNFTTVNIPAGVTVSFAKNSTNTPVTILATGDVNIAGIINLNGSSGAPAFSSGPIVSSGGAGGQGGFSGGQGGARGATNNASSGGQGPGGGPPRGAGTYGAASSFVSLIPLFGGSGGGGGFGTATSSGASGGGGGGAIVIASSSKIVVTGSITANGGNGNAVQQFQCVNAEAGGGSGGAIRLVAPEISGTGTLQAVAGLGGGPCSGSTPGRVRLEAFTHGYAGTSNPVFSTAVSPGPVTDASHPALANLPTLTISSIGGEASSATPAASYTTADVSLPSGTTNPVPVVLAATNTPVGTVFTVKLIPQFANPTEFTAASTGTFSNSTAAIDVTFPQGEVSLINAYASFTLPTQIASALPLIEGEPVESVLLASDEGEGALKLVTRSGKEFPAKKTLGEERLAALWSGLSQAQ